LRCLETFTAGRKFDLEQKYQAAELYFDKEASFRAVGRELDIEPHTALKWINDMGANCKSFVAVAAELQPKWGGMLLADGRYIGIKGVEHALLLTADAATQDIVNAALVKAEDEANWKRVFLELRDEIHYPVKGIIVDGDLGLFAAVREVFPEIPIQFCLVHAYRSWERYLKYEYRGSARGIEDFAERVGEIVAVRTLEHWAEALRHWSEKRHFLIRCGHRHLVERVEELAPFYFAFLENPGMPPTTNIIEGIIRQLGRKIDDTDGFQRMDNAWNSLKLLIMRYRFHKFTCSHIKGHNGFSPLELSGVSTNGASWITFSQA